MTKNCKQKNPLQRDGTSQEQRTLKTLLPGYVSVDERSMDDLQNFVVKFAEEINFFNQNDIENPDGNWKDFFDKTVQTGSQLNAPHFALFIAFLKIFKHAQDDVNQITKRHLDFYYRDVLHLYEKPAVPDQVYLIFELAKHVTSHLLKKKTGFKAGKDELGNNVTYQTTDETSLNVAGISELKAIFVNKHNIFSEENPVPGNEYRIYKSPVANSEDGNGAALESGDKSWRTFGGIKFPGAGKAIDKITGADRQLAEVGFAFSTPNLFLAEGERIVTVYLNLADESKKLLDNFTEPQLNKAFRFRFSGEKKWIEPVWEKTKTKVLGDVDSIIEKRILDFVNKAKTAVDIAGIEPVKGPVYDDPETGYGDQINDYDIGITVANRIISVRNSLGAAGFTSLDQLYNIPYVGMDKINDLVYSFGDPLHSVKIDKINNRIIIKRTITRDQEPIVAYDEKVLLEPFDTKWPVLKVVLNNENTEDPFIYKSLKDLKLKSADIEVDVREVKNLVLQNDQSVLDPGKPFQPFGNRPFVGSNFYIGSWEVFQKSLNALTLNMKWSDLPDDAKGFRDYYKNYYPQNNSRLNDKFVAEVSLLDKKSWVQLNAKSRLFAGNDNEPLKPENIIAIPNPSPSDEPLKKTIGDVKKDENLESFDIFDQKSQKGFVRLTLKDIDFGHKDYQLSYTKAVLAAIDIAANPPVTDYSGDLPNEPYTPVMEEFSLDYVATEHIDATGLPEEDAVKQTAGTYHVGVFGVARLDASKKENHLCPQYNNEGELYIGIKDLNPPQNLSVLFQNSEGTSDPDLLPPKITWSYLAGNEWVDFSSQQILSDSTKGLITTGIILFDIPSKADSKNTILPRGLHWIRASAENSTGGIPMMIDIKCQAAKVEFADSNNDPGYLRKPLPEKTISKPVKADSAIKKVEQPFVSFGGKVQEESNEFYKRVSERLRHKNRAIAIWDYERIILQNFPSIYKVKCLNHTRYDKTLASINEAAPGHVSLVVVSGIRNSNVGDPLKPRTSLVTLYDIHAFIKKIHSPFVNLYVNNPVYEEIQVEFNVKFHTGFDKGIYQVKLEEALKEYLSPWAYETGSDIVFGGKIHKSVILNFVEEQEYVDYVTCFRMYHIIPGGPGHDSTVDVDEAMASTSASVLGSADTHKIHILETDNGCECPDNQIISVEIASSDECPCD